MQFKVSGAMGDSHGLRYREDFGGVQGFFLVVAANRVDAFIKLFEWLTRQGNDVTILHLRGSSCPLGFSSADLDVIAAAGISLRSGLPKSGFQVGEIVPV